MYGDLISTCFRKIDSSKYFLIKIFKDKNKEEYTIVAISIFPKGLKYSTKFKNKGEMLINMQGTDISTILSENLEISNNKLRINFKYNPIILQKNDEILINELPFIDNNTNDDPLLIFQNEG